MVSKKYLSVLATISLLVAALGLVVGTASAQPGDYVAPEKCKSCHSNAYSTWNESAHGAGGHFSGTGLNATASYVTPTECGHCMLDQKAYADANDLTYEAGEDSRWVISCVNCHPNAADHSANPMEIKPKVDLSAELCGRCHGNSSHHPVYQEWNETADEDWDSSTMASHSEPAESFTVRKPCASCKTTDGAIANLEKEGVYEFNEEEVPNGENITETRITCVACHNPHEAKLRIENTSKLCSNCHNAENPAPDGETTEVHHSQYETYNGSHWTKGEVNLQCEECHMATRPVDEDAGVWRVTGHSFDWKPELLGSANYSGAYLESQTSICGNCHTSHRNLEAAVEATQSSVKERIESLEALKERTHEILVEANNSEALALYNNASYYPSFVENDGSYGVHNSGRTQAYLDKAQALFLEAQRESTNSEVTDLSNVVSSLEGTVQTVQSSVSDLESGLNNLEGTVQTVQSSVSDLESGLNNLEGIVQTVQNSVSDLSSTVNDVEQSVLPGYTLPLAVLALIIALGAVGAVFFRS
ncbi:hypothetical protein C9439_01295 [archaeon SCG-AAA382B04]|nr:hypothetical protein C9439_01295 [archaeon SCG-AAA382B04]